MVDWLLELSLHGAETGAAAGQNDKNNENSDPVYSCNTLYFSVVFVRFESLQLAGLVNLFEYR